MNPTDSFKTLHSLATTHFLENEFDLAEEYALQAIQENPEIFTAHSLLSEIHFARGDRNRALTALFHGAHTRPRDTQVWCQVAKLILERAGHDRSTSIADAIYCYNRVIGAEPQNITARYERAELHREVGNPKRAAYDYLKLLKALPHSQDVLKNLAEVSIELGGPDRERAIKHYEQAIEHFQNEGPEHSFTWSDANLYAELFVYAENYERGLVQIKAIARWLLGRGEEIWDDLTDDREFDGDDHRRALVPGYQAKADLTYGQGLPLELRMKLGVFRLKLGGEHVQQATVSLPNRHHHTHVAGTLRLARTR